MKKIYQSKLLNMRSHSNDTKTPDVVSQMGWLVTNYSLMQSSNTAAVCFDTFFPCPLEVIKYGHMKKYL